MKSKKIVFAIIALLLLNSFLVSNSINNVSSNSENRQLEQTTFDDSFSSSEREISIVAKTPKTELNEKNIEEPKNNIFDTRALNPEDLDLMQVEEDVQSLEKQSFSQDFIGIKLTVNNTPDVIQIYYERLDGTIVTYGLPGETLEIHLYVKGLISSGDRLNIDFRRDIVNGLDSNLWSGYYDFSSDLLGDESLHLFATVALDPDLSDFGLGTGDIRSYFLRIYLDSGPYLFDGSNMVEEYRLWMYGYLRLYGVEYFNYTSYAGLVNVSYAVPGWEIYVKFYLAVVQGPIWDFDIQGTIKADVKWGLDETLYQDTQKLIDWVLEPGLYYYEWSDASWIAMSFIVPVRDYGNQPGDTRSLFGILSKDGSQVSPLNPDNERDELNIIPNTIQQPPQVLIELPLDGYVTYNTTVSLAVDIEDPNSNYDITSVEVLVEGSWLDGTSFYYPTTGRFDVYITNAFTSAGIKNITVKAEDSVGNIGFDSVIIQYFNYGYFFPPAYSVFNKKDSMNIFNEYKTYSVDFKWDDENSNITISPFLSLTVEAALEYELLVAYPNDVTPGSDFNAYIKVVNPELTLTINFDLGVAYSFTSEEYYYEGSTTLYNKDITKALAMNFGIYRIDLRDISEEIAELSRFEVETQTFLPSYVSWLANFKFEADFIPIVKIKNLLSFDISGTNCNPAFSSLSITTDSLYVIPCTTSSSATGNDDATITLSNFSIDTAVGFELYCQMTFSGKILGFVIGPVDVNKWLYDYFGFLVPYIDIWLASVSIPLSGTENIIFPLNPLGFSAKIIGMFYSLDNITYTFEIKDSNGNLVSGATIQVDDHSQTYYATDEGAGIYEVVMDYYDLPEAIDVTVTKSGYTTLATSFNLFVDPPAVTKGVIWEFVYISIGVLSVITLVSVLAVRKLRRGK